MPGPWEKYQSAPDAAPAQPAGPWTKYQSQQPPAAPAQPPAEEPGFLSRFYGNTVGPIAGLVNDYTKHVAENQPKYGVLGGFPAVMQTLSDVGNGITGGFTNAASKTGEALKKGDYIHALQQAPGMVPFIGPPSVQAGEDLEKGNYGATLGDVAGLGASLASPEIARGTGSLIKMPAGPIAETALGVRNVDRAFHRNPGEAILENTRGIKPAVIAKSASGKIGDLVKQRDAAIDASPNMGSLQPTRDLIQNRIADAMSHNAKEKVSQLEPIQNHITKNAFTGTSLSPTQPARGILNLRQGVNDDFVTNWKPERQADVNGTARDVYRSLSNELHSTVPESAPLDRSISNLIPVKNRAAATDLNANTMQRTLGRFARPTGALAGGISGAFEGGRLGGLPGALMGGIAGLGAPELIASPSVQMITARGLHGLGKGIQSLAPAAEGAKYAPLVRVKGSGGGESK